MQVFRKFTRLFCLLNLTKVINDIAIIIIVIVTATMGMILMIKDKVYRQWILFQVHVLSF